MSSTARTAAAALGVGYLLLTSYAMTAYSYEIWGAFVIGPIILAISIPLLGRMFRDEDRDLYPIAVAGLAAKLVGAMFFYWLALDAFGGESDSASYHFYGRQIAAEIRDGSLSLWGAVPTSQGTPFIEEITGLLYAVFGSSELGGFLLFAWMAYWGALFFVRAAALAVPGIDRSAYAALVLFLPSIVLWSAITGKEAVVMFGLGIASYGSARLLTGRWGGWSVPVTIIGLLIAGLVRPHFAGMWVGALVLALVVGSLTGSAGRGALGRVGTIFFAVVALAGLVVVAQITLRYLDPSGDDGDEAVGDRISSIIETTERNTTVGGSSFEPIHIRGPQDWPVAIYRTLTRPMLNEARNLGEILPAAETSVLFLLAAIRWRRLASLPRMLLRSPYVVFAVVVLIAFGLAWSVFGNLGLLVRQRSLVAPLMVLLLCLPQIGRSRAPADVEAPVGLDRELQSA